MEQEKKPVYNLNGVDISRGTTNPGAGRKFGIPIPEDDRDGVLYEDRCFKYIGQDGREWTYVALSSNAYDMKEGQRNMTPGQKIALEVFQWTATVVFGGLILMVILGLKF